MIDAFSILLTHGLILLAAWRMLARDDLDTEPDRPAAQPAVRDDPAARPWLANQKYLRSHEQDDGQNGVAGANRDA